MAAVGLAVAAGDHALGFREALTGRQFDEEDGPRWIVGVAVAGVPFLAWVAGARSHTLFRPGAHPREFWIGSTYLEYGPLSVAVSPDELVGTRHDPTGARATLTADGRFDANGLPGSQCQHSDPTHLPAPIDQRWPGQGRRTYERGTLTLTAPARDDRQPPSTPPEFTLEELQPRGSHQAPRRDPT